MSDDKIAEIRARHIAVMQEKAHKRYEDRNGAEAHNDRATLLAEVERHREEIERLRAEIEKLRADNERLRPTEMSPAEKMKILDDLRAQETRRRAALEGKP